MKTIQLLVCCFTNKALDSEPSVLFVTAKQALSLCAGVG